MSLPTLPRITVKTDQLATARGMLEEQRAFRVAQLIELAKPGRPGPLGSAHAEITATLTRGARRALHDVQSALWRIEEGSYGRCTSCSAPVEPERLEILPHVALCMPCERAGRR